MSTARHLVYRTLNRPSIAELVGGDNPRIFAKKTMTSSVEEHPYIVYKLGNETSEEFSDAEDAPDISRQYLQIWVHDYTDGDTADYDRIDTITSAIRAEFRNLGSAIDDVWTTRYLETSQDLNDETLNTVFRYLRFQMIKKE